MFSFWGFAPGPHQGLGPWTPLGVSQQSKPQTQWRTGAMIPPRTVWEIFLPTKNYVSDHHKSIYGGQKPFSFWGLRPQTPTKHVVHGIANMCNVYVVWFLVQTHTKCCCQTVLKSLFSNRSSIRHWSQSQENVRPKLR